MRHLRRRCTWAVAAAACAIAPALWSVPGAGAAPSTSPASTSAGAAFDDPLGPLVDVTADWQHYQPSSDFCIKPDVIDYPAASDATATGADPACRASGFSADATGLVEVKIDTPPLCSGCRRYFIDYSLLGPSTPADPSAHGHAYFRMLSFNPTYTVEPTAHSPNIKNFTNDELVSPPNSPQYAVMSRLDPELMAYAADTANFAHTAAQGPYYIGPWYVNEAGQRIDGAYVDVSLTHAVDLHDATLDSIVYAAGFDSDPSSCVDAALLGSAYADGNYFYGGCVNDAAASAPPGLDPWPDPAGLSGAAR
jgi:hypothetical protein